MEGYSEILQRLSALERRVSTVLRTGKVHAVQADPYRARLDVGPDEGGGAVVTNWLPVLVLRAGDVRTWSPLTVGEAALMLSPGGQDHIGFVLPALVSDAYPAASAQLDEDVVSWRTTDGAAEAGRVRMQRGTTAAASTLVLECGAARLTLAGNGRVTLRRSEFDVVTA